MLRHSVPTVYVIEALRQLRQAGPDVAALLEVAGITPEHLADPAALITDRQYVVLLMGLIRLTNDELHGQGSRRPVPRGSFALMCHAIIHLPTLKKALLRGLMFYNGLLDGIHLKLHKRGERATLSVSWDDPGLDPAHVTTEALLTVLQRFASWLIDQRLPLIEATFTHTAPTHVAHYHKLFHCPLRFEQAENSIVFEARYLNYPLMQDEASLRDFLRAAPGNLFVPLTNTQALTAQIRALLGKNFTEEFPDFEEVAARLNMTPQTLRRKLKEEASSYQGIKDHLRRDAAIYYLSRPQYSIGEIAQLMGFSEPSTFHRAFKKWTGITPGEYRQGLNL